MNRIGTFQLAVMFCGCFLGAGFLSGNELWQFFASFGMKGLIGSIISVLLIGVFCAFILEISVAKRIENPELVILPKRYHKSSMLFGVLQAVVVFAIIVIMAAGSSTLVNDVMGINRNIVGIIFCATICVFVLLGTERIVAAFSVLIPFIALSSVVIGIVVICGNFETLNIPRIEGSGNKLLGNWVASSVAYLSYSVFSSVGVFSAVSGKIRNRSSIWLGMFIGSAIMCVMAVVIIFVIWSFPDAMQAELPMLSAAMSVGKLSGGIYSVLLFFGMFGAALSCYMSLGNYFRIKFALNRKAFSVVAIIIGVAAFFGSIFGFGDLVGTIYPLFGYIGIAVLISLAVNFIRLRKTKKTIDFSSKI